MGLACFLQVLEQLRFRRLAFSDVWLPWPLLVLLMLVFIVCFAETLVCLVQSASHILLREPSSIQALPCACQSPVGPWLLRLRRPALLECQWWWRRMSLWRRTGQQPGLAGRQTVVARQPRLARQPRFRQRPACRRTPTVTRTSS